jgi:hypothetical protein
MITSILQSLIYFETAKFAKDAKNNAISDVQ